MRCCRSLFFRMFKSAMLWASIQDEATFQIAMLCAWIHIAISVFFSNVHNCDTVGVNAILILTFVKFMRLGGLDGLVGLVGLGALGGLGGLGGQGFAKTSASTLMRCGARRLVRSTQN